MLSKTPMSTVFTTLISDGWFPKLPLEWPIKFCLKHSRASGAHSGGKTFTFTFFP